MTDKLTPAHLTAGEMWRAFAEYACLAGVDPQVRQCYLDRAKLSDEEAARREAEQKPLCVDPKACDAAGCMKPTECSNAAVERGHIPLIMCPGNTRACGGFGCLSAGCAYGLKSGEAARREAEAKELGRTTACAGEAEPVVSLRASATARNVTTPMVEREGLDSADAELAHSLRSVVTVDYSWPPMALSIIRRYEMDRLAAKDRIEAQAREIALWQEAAGKSAVRGEQLEDMLEKRDREYDALKARVAELERLYEREQTWYAASEKALAGSKAHVARLTEAVRNARGHIGKRLDDMTPVQRECAVNEAWHMLNAALLHEARAALAEANDAG